MNEWKGDEPIASWIELAVRDALAKRAARPPLPSVAHERQIALSKTRAYYDELNQRPAFVAALTALFELWSDRGAEQLAQAWHLPPEGTKDLRHSYNLWSRQRVRRPVLEPDSRPFPGMPNTGALAEKLGYRVRPPRSANAADLAQGARRLAQHVVDGKSWYEIAGDEGETYPRETRAQRTQVANFAKELRIALPKNKAGRPPRVRSA